MTGIYQIIIILKSVHPIIIHFTKIKVICFNLRYNHWQENPIQYKHDYSRRHHKHGSWVEFPPRPLLCVVASKSRELGISFLVFLPETFGAVPGEFNSDDTDESLGEEVDAEDLEPCLCKDSSLVWSINDRIFSKILW